MGSPPLGFYPTPTRFLRPAFASALLVLRRTRQITRSTERRPGALAPGVPANAPRPTEGASAFGLGEMRARVSLWPQNQRVTSSNEKFRGLCGLLAKCIFADLC